MALLSRDAASGRGGPHFELTPNPSAPCVSVLATLAASLAAILSELEVHAHAEEILGQTDAKR